LGNEWWQEEESHTKPEERELWEVDRTHPEWTTPINNNDNAGNWNSGGGTHKHR
jgi:hypothetical protein